jgi:hypothetical protein
MLPPHTLPHVPQLLASVARSRQVPLHAVSFALQQTPALHRPAHATPQALQLF